MLLTVLFQLVPLGVPHSCLSLDLTRAEVQLLSHLFSGCSAGPGRLMETETHSCHSQAVVGLSHKSSRTTWPRTPAAEISHVCAVVSPCHHLCSSLFAAPPSFYLMSPPKVSQYLRHFQSQRTGQVCPTHVRHKQGTVSGNSQETEHLLSL